jgi:hypothetical protein
MKKIYSFLAVAIMMAMPAFLTSCDDDDWYDDYWYDNWKWGKDYNIRPDDSNVDNNDFFVAMAQTLVGQWRGTLTAYQVDSAGNYVDTVNFETDIEFVQYNSTAISGTGTQWDFKPGTNICELKRSFTWSIDPECGDITLKYKTQNQDGSYTPYSMIIPYNQLNLDDRTFTGYLIAEDNKEVDDFWFNRYTSDTRAAQSKKIKKVVVVFK